MTRGLKVGGQVLAGALVAGLLALLIWRVAHQSSPPKVGKPAPHFSLELLDGNGTLALDRLRGKAVVVNFWASWCGPCKTESAALERAWRKHKANGVVVLGIDYHDVVGDAKRFVDKHELTYPILRDRDGAVGTRYDLTGVPETFFIDRQGRLVGESLQGPIDKGDNVEKFEQGIQAALGSS
jgi:cytochrome c biogenesis protein CcmG, thiol:disulfide interchange protein DsbE